MNLIATAPVSLDAYRGIVSDQICDEIEQLASAMRGLRIAHVNATPVGGGVAEILRSLVPLMSGVGLEAQWYVLPPEGRFFAVTKRIHNMLQGEAGELSDEEFQVYLDFNQRIAEDMLRIKTDVWVIHDPQPMPVVAMQKALHPAIWRCHIDTSRPNPWLIEKLLPFIMEYDHQIFTLPDFIFPSLPRENVTFFSPAIDPLVGKNIPIDRDIARRILHKLGIDPRHQVMTQVSRFDPWKDPIGVIDAYRMARMHVPDLQLALVGVMAATDDPQQAAIFAEVERHAGGDPNIHLYTKPELVSDAEVNAFQTASDVVVQKSLREGFGLTVTEAMWKGNPVVGGRAGGVAVQIHHDVNGFLVRSVEECSDYVVRLLQDRDLADRLGNAARESVRNQYLMPSLLRDYLRLLGEQLRRQQAA